MDSYTHYYLGGAPATRLASRFRARSSCLVGLTERGVVPIPGVRRLDLLDNIRYYGFAVQRGTLWTQRLI